MARNSINRDLHGKEVKLTQPHKEVGSNGHLKLSQKDTLETVLKDPVIGPDKKSEQPTEKVYKEIEPKEGSAIEQGLEVVEKKTDEPVVATAEEIVEEDSEQEEIEDSKSAPEKEPKKRGRTKKSSSKNKND